MPAPNFRAQKIGQIGSSFDPNTINAEIDFLHQRINSLADLGLSFVKRVLVDNHYKVKPEDCYIGVSTGIRAVTIQLPAAIDAEPLRIYTIKDELANAGTFNITVLSVSTIDRAASKTISTNSGYLRVFSTGTEWFSL